VSAPRGHKPAALARRFVELVAKRQQRWIANVSVTRPLTQAQIRRLQAGLNAVYGRELRINITVDPSLVGGVRVQVGDEVVDSTVVTRLAELRRKLAV
jgi:F-type H+-transporting ATPase subunit delta